MNNKLPSLLALLVVLAAAERACCQEGALKVPPMARTAFIVRIPQNNSATPSPTPIPAPGKSLAKHPVEIAVTRYDSNQRNGITWSDGSTTEDWLHGKFFLWRNPYSNGINALGFTEEPNLLRPYRFTFPGYFEWVGKATFVGGESLGQTPANRFRNPVSSEEVWIDARTGIPLKFSDGTATVEFIYTDPPGAALTLPESYAQALAKTLETIRSPKPRPKRF